MDQSTSRSEFKPDVKVAFALMALLTAVYFSDIVFTIFSGLGYGVITTFTYLGYGVVTTFTHLSYATTTTVNFLVAILNWLLVYIVYPIGVVLLALLLVLAIISVGLSGLLIAGVFTCPTEQSFSLWLKSLTDNTPNNELNDIAADAILSQKAINYFKRYIFKTFTTAALILSLNPRFYHVGFCRVAICDVNREEQHIFVGAFNTWFPIK